MDNVEWLMRMAYPISNMNKPESDNNFGRCATEIKELRKHIIELEDTLANMEYDNMEQD